MSLIHRGWARVGGLEAHALAVAVGFHLSLLGAAILVNPLWFLLFFTRSFTVNDGLALTVAFVGLYLGLSLTFARSGPIRHWLFVPSALYWSAVGLMFYTASGSPSIGLAPILANALLSVLGWWRSRAWK